MRANGLLEKDINSNGSALNSDLPLEEKILLEKRLDFVSKKDQKGPTTDLFFHELTEKETRPKRYFELAVGFIGFLYFMITLPLYALLILITSGRPIFETSHFVGFKGKRYARYFYRTHKKSDPTQPTLFGKFLEITGLNKLPNFINILNGSMSLVGPSPLSVNKSEELNKEFTDFYKRFATKPGIIGIRNGTSWETDQERQILNKNLKLELKYLVYPTLKKDIQVLSGNFEEKVLR